MMPSVRRKRKTAPGIRMVRMVICTISRKISAGAKYVASIAKKDIVAYSGINNG